MLIRAVAEEEYEAAGRLVVAAYRALPDAAVSGGYEAVLADVAGRAGETEVLVALAEHAADRAAPELLGCVTYVPDAANPWAEQLEPEEASIRMLAVDPSAQGRGVGSALLDACIERARRAGRSAVFLHSTPWMPAAHRIYQRAGFVRVPPRDWLPVPEVPLLAFRLALAAG